MELIAGMEPTGRQVAGPAADLIEVTSENGLKHLVFQYRDEYRDHPLLDSQLQSVIGFIEKPGVTGLVSLSHHLPEVGAFVYPTGTSWTVAEVVRVFADKGEACGVKAGMELCYLVGEILTEAVEIAAQHGIGCHGQIDPYRLLVKADGQVQIVGYGVPPVGMRVYLDNKKKTPREDTFRYSPPERFKGDDEDLSSDLYSLALIALEVMMGRPAYDGLVDDIAQQASRGESVRRLYQWRETLPASVREVLGRALKPDPDTRYREGADFVYAVHDVLSSVDADGPSLVEVMAKFRAHLARGRAVEGGTTGQLTQEQLAELAGELDDEDHPLPPPRLERPPDPEDVPEQPSESEEAPRWGSVKRPGAAPAPEGEGARSSAADLRDRLRKSSRRKQRPASNGVDAKERLKEHLKGRESGGNVGGERVRRRRRGSEPAAEEAAPVGARPRRRSSRRTEESAAKVQTVPVEAEPAPEPAPAPEATAVADPVADPQDVPEEEHTVPVSTNVAARALLQRLKNRDSTDSKRRRRAAMETEAKPETETESGVETELESEAEPESGVETELESEAEPELELDAEPVEELEPQPSLDAGYAETDLIGHVVAWHRAGGRVENRVVIATFTVQGVDPPLHFRAPVGTAVPVKYLLAHLQRWLALPTADWTLAVQGRTLGPLEILADVEDGDLVIVVSM